jgi:hypothetical protein
MRLPALIAAAVVALALTSGPGFARTSLTDRTFSCATGDMGGVSGFVVSADPTTRGSDNGLEPAILSVDTDQGSTTLLLLGTRAKGFTIDGGKCRSVRARVPLTKRGLPLTTQVDGGGYGGGFSGRCFRGGRILLHLRLSLDAKGLPARALLAVQLAQTKRTVAFVSWSPQRVSAYLWPRCPL